MQFLRSLQTERKHDKYREKEKRKRASLGKSFFVISALLDKELSKQYLVVQIYVLVAVEVELVSGFF